MPLDPQARAALDLRAGAPPLESLTPTQARAQSAAVPRLPGPEVAKVEDVLVPGDGVEVPVRVYTPAGERAGALVWLHGGGWVIGSIETNDATCRALANEAGCVVVSVGYRLAPEAKFPLPLDDCYAAAVWTVGPAAALGFDPRAVAIGGASAGGNLAAAVALMARERGGPALAHQLLVYPVVENDDSSQSFQDNGEGYGLDRTTMRWYWDHYVRDEADASNPLAAPLLADDLSGLPPALIITAEYDPLRDGGEAYAERLRQAGVETACSRYDGMIHGFFSAGAPVDRTWDAIAEAAAALRGAFTASAGAAG